MGCSVEPVAREGSDLVVVHASAAAALAAAAVVDSKTLGCGKETAAGFVVELADVHRDLQVHVLQ